MWTKASPHLFALCLLFLAEMIPSAKCNDWCSVDWLVVRYNFIIRKPAGQRLKRKLKLENELKFNRDLQTEVCRHFTRPGNVKKSRDQGLAVRFTVWVHVGTARPRSRGKWFTARFFVNCENSCFSSLFAEPASRRVEKRLFSRARFFCTLKHYNPTSEKKYNF